MATKRRLKLVFYILADLNGGRSSTYGWSATITKTCFNSHTNLFRQAAADQPVPGSEIVGSAEL